MEHGAPGWSHGLVGQSPQIREVRRLIEKLGRTACAGAAAGGERHGQRGGGARHPRRESRAANSCPSTAARWWDRWWKANCSATPRAHSRGAAEAKKGLIEVADGGTAFFDEIGDLPLEMQVKLLRLLQEHEFRPVGSLKQRKVNIRVIAATHHDLARDAARETFRQDLYYRLNIVTRAAAAAARPQGGYSGVDRSFPAAFGGAAPTDARKRWRPCSSYDWPGNVRELQNSIERMVALNTGPWLHVADLPSALQNHQPRRVRRLVPRWPPVRRRRRCLYCAAAAAVRIVSARPWRRRPS